MRCSSPSPLTPHAATNVEPIDARWSPSLAASSHRLLRRDADDEAGTAARVGPRPTRRRPGPWRARPPAPGRGRCRCDGGPRCPGRSARRCASARRGRRQVRRPRRRRAGRVRPCARSTTRVGPPPWWLAFSSRLARIRSKRSLSTVAESGEPLPVRSGTSRGRSRKPLRSMIRRHSVDDVDLLGVQLGRAGVDARQLEEVDDHGVEAPDLADDDVERLLRAVGELAAPAVDDLGGGGQGGDRGAQLVAHVGGEAGLALDAGLDGVGHVVERVDQPVEVGVAFEGDARAQVAGGDLARRVRDPPERLDEAAARPPSRRPWPGAP